jgi:peptidyl-tRNA hydrolase, PTH2 family
MIKQVICVRKDLRNINGQKIRTGKLCAQVAHASMKVFFDRKLVPCVSTLMIPLTEEMEQWVNNEFTKICVGVNSEQELLDVHKAAVEKGLPCSLIQDAGHTEFKEPTYTTVAIGPAKSELVDEITGKLTLL